MERILCFALVLFILQVPVPIQHPIDDPGIFWIISDDALHVALQL